MKNRQETKHIFNFNFTLLEKIYLLDLNSLKQLGPTASKYLVDSQEISITLQPRDINQITRLCVKSQRLFTMKVFITSKYKTAIRFNKSLLQAISMI